jgi:hypothetical protein
MTPNASSRGAGYGVPARSALAALACYCSPGLNRACPHFHLVSKANIESITAQAVSEPKTRHQKQKPARLAGFVIRDTSRQYLYRVCS